ncbi:MAG: type II toxin-antitoxin system VapC family toxin [Rubrobacter sp.]
MSPPIFVDANVPIYAAGRSHPLKEPCAEILRLVAERPGMFFTDAEVLRELLHRYLALRLWPQGKEVLLRFSVLMHERVEPVYAADVESAAVLAERNSASGLSARDLLHSAVVLRLGRTRIISADRAFGRISDDVELLDPKDFDSWRVRLEG